MLLMLKGSSLVNAMHTRRVRQKWEIKKCEQFAGSPLEGEVQKNKNIRPLWESNPGHENQNLMY